MCISRIKNYDDVYWNKKFDTNIDKQRSYGSVY